MIASGNGVRVAGRRATAIPEMRRIVTEGRRRQGLHKGHDGGRLGLISSEVLVAPIWLGQHPTGVAYGSLSSNVMGVANSLGGQADIWSGVTCVLRHNTFGPPGRVGVCMQKSVRVISAAVDCGANSGVMGL